MFFPKLLQDYFLNSVQKFPQKVALICGEKKFTYRQIDDHSTQLAVSLIRLGLRRQDRVIIFLDNTEAAIISIYGILKAGGVFVVLNGTLKSRKLAYVVKDAGAKIIISHTSKAKVVAEAVSEIQSETHFVWDGPGEGIPAELKSHSISLKSVYVENDDAGKELETLKRVHRLHCIDVDLAALIYTSGSTGDPKGVMSTHHNMVSATRSIVQYLENDENDIILAVLPLSFDYGLYQVLMAFMFGGTIVLERSFLYIHQVLKRIEEEKVTAFPIVPTVLAMLLTLENLTNYDFSTLRYMSNTGAALPVEHIRKLRKLFPNVKLYSMFGLTECKRVCYLPPAELDRRPDSVGIPMPNCEVYILNENGEEVASGEVGELVIRGSNVMQGYWNSPELTAKYYRAGRYPADRLLYSGDYFKRDEDGFLYFLGRKDDMIKTRGERVSAKEVENILCELDGVAEVAVIGVPDEIFGQAIKAFIVTDNRNHLTEKDVLKFSTANMEPFMVPKYVQFLDSLPKTANGKIDKKLLSTSA
ncbi:AMP-binding protein [candidate division KSB1 bacterium]|nr:AMP-binding protein [candidate division KSB1 bacterium]